MPNIDRLEAVYDHILTDPEHHNQTVYGAVTSCGTEHCYAGWALVLFGTLDYYFDELSYQFRRASDDHVIGTASTAAALLDIPVDYVQGSDRLFGSGTSLAQIRSWIDEFRHREGLPPREFNTRRNIDLMEQVWDQICEQPELHNQELYVELTPCGMAHCFGGWAAVLSGWTVRSSDHNSWSRPDGSLVESHQFAREAQALLGLTASEAWGDWALFETDRTPEQIRAAIDLYRVEAGLPKRLDAPTYRAG